MKQISNLGLWLGNAADGRDLVAISQTEIHSVVQLAVEEPVPELLRSLHFFRIPLHDGAGNDAESLQFALNTIRDLIRLQRRTLICCSAGLSRSPAVAACGMALAEDRAPAECLGEIGRLVRTDISPGLWKDLLDAHEVLAGD